MVIKMRLILITLLGCGAYGYIRWLETQAASNISIHSHEYLIAVIAFFVWTAVVVFDMEAMSSSRGFLPFLVTFVSIAFWLNDHLSWIDPSITSPPEHSLFAGLFHLFCLSLFGSVFAIAALGQTEDMAAPIIGGGATFFFAITCSFLVSRGVDKYHILLWSGTLFALPMVLVKAVPAIEEYLIKLRKTINNRRIAKDQAIQSAVQLQRDIATIEETNKRNRAIAEETNKRNEEQRLKDEARRAWELTLEGQSHLAKQELLQVELAAITVEKSRLQDERVRIERGIADSKAMKDAAEAAVLVLERGRKENEASLEAKSAAANESIRDNHHRAENELGKMRDQQKLVFNAEVADIERRLEKEAEVKQANQGYKKEVLRIRDSVQRAFENMILSAQAKTQSVDAEIKRIRGSNLDSEMIEEEVARFEASRIDLLNEIARLRSSLAQLG